VPRAAEAYRRQIALGLDGDQREALKARMMLRYLFGGEVRMVPLEGGQKLTGFGRTEADTGASPLDFT